VKGEDTQRSKPWGCVAKAAGCAERMSAYFGTHGVASLGVSVAWCTHALGAKPAVWRVQASAWKQRRAWSACAAGVPLRSVRRRSESLVKAAGDVGAAVCEHAQSGSPF